MKTVVIVAGESSGELYGSLLAKKLKHTWPDVHLLGVGGEKMREAGVEIISPISDAFGLIEAITAFRKIKHAYRKTVDAVLKQKPDVIVLIDYPDFNLKLAKRIRHTGVKILYYVSPQVWAWRKRRVKRIAHLVDRMAVILPFEEKIYQAQGVQSEFVGHPVMEEIESVLKKDQDTWNHPDKELRSRFKDALGLEPGKSLLSLLPGSRPHELNRLLPVMGDVARRFRSAHPDLQLCMPLAPNTDAGAYRRYIDILKQENVHIIQGKSVHALAASDVAVIASGTATLQAALLEVPMVVIYKLSPVTFFLGKLIVDVKHISLVNILAGQGVVKELLQGQANAEEILNELDKIMHDTGYSQAMRKQFQKIKHFFVEKRPSERVSRIIAELAGWQ